MPLCLWCHTEYQQSLGWSGLLFHKEERICGECKEKLVPITGEVCTICGRELGRLKPDFHESNTCNDCRRWEQDPNWAGILAKNRSLFHYNDFLKEVIARFKYRGDHAMVEAFTRGLQQMVKQHFRDMLIVPIPLSKERHYERGFNQSEAIAQLLGKTTTNLLIRTNHEKQSKKTREERLKLEGIFQMEETRNLEGQSVLLIDDIYTTGSTLRHAAHVLKQAGAETVCSITIARG